MPWSEFQSIIDTIINALAPYKFNAIAPILRSGAIPATMIANKLQIISTIPIQVKYNYEQKSIDVLQKPKCPENLKKEDIKNILVTECNTFSGNSAKKVLELLKNEFPHAKIHYACVTKVFGGPESIEGYESYTVGQWTNEAFKDEAPVYCREGITIYPWETAESELQDINNDF
jgi:hypoxanthine phosphoribosyltransferase